MKTVMIIKFAFGLLLMNFAYAGSHDLYGFDRLNDDSTRIESSTTFQSVSYPKRMGWRDWVVELNIKRAHIDNGGAVKTWNDKVSVHFTGSKMATAFTHVMNGEKGADLYYNFSENPYNSESQNSACRLPVLGVFCKNFPVIIINRTDVDADNLYVFDKARGKKVELEEYLEAATEQKIAFDDELLHDKQYDGSEMNDSGRRLNPKHDLKKDSTHQEQTAAEAASA